jgi:type 1 glutamine amidotransferase
MRLRDAIVVVICAGYLPGCAGTESRSILVFSRTAAFRHESIADGIRALQDLGPSNGFAVVTTEQPETFTDAELRKHAAVVFLNTSGDVLDETQQAAFERYIRAGGGFVGVHSAADTEYGWGFYVQLVGATFRSHDAIQEGVLTVDDRGHPASAKLPAPWRVTDEWYNFRASPRGKVHVLLSLDETSVRGGLMGADHPIAWYREIEGGRSFYTARGHTREAYAEPAFRDHLVGGIRWAAGLEPATAATPLPDLGVHLPIDVESGGDGALYALEYGPDDYFYPGTGRLVRIEGTP